MNKQGDGTTISHIGDMDHMNLKRRIHNISVDFISQNKYTMILTMIDEEIDDRWQRIFYQRVYFVDFSSYYENI